MKSPGCAKSVRIRCSVSDVEDNLEELRDLIQKLKKVLSDTPTRRIMAFGVSMESELQIPPVSPYRSVEFGTFGVLMLHTAMRHPEWVQAIVADTIDIFQMAPEDYEVAIREIVEMYHVPSFHDIAGDA